MDTPARAPQEELTLASPPPAPRPGWTAGAARPSQGERFAEALNALRQVVGEGHVETERSRRQHWARTTLPEGTLPRAIVQPGSTAEIQKVMQIVSLYKIQVFPLSTGCNWGYGCACAPRDGQLILDLRRMNRILEVNTELAYATFEPGVTQGQLADYLERHGLPLAMDATGAGPETSIIGNTLERGFGHSPHGDRFSNSCDYEVVLADGSLLRTGFGHYTGAQAAAHYRYGVGPALDGLFTQSNFGIVTRMTMWLLPRTEAFEAFFFSLRDPEGLPALVEALRPLRLRGTLRTPIHIGNDLRLISLAQSYPWEEMAGQTPLSPAVRAQLRKRHGLQAWFGSGSVSGSPGEVRAAVREVRKALKTVPGVNGVYFFNDFRLRWGKRLLAGLNRLGFLRAQGRLAGKLDFLYQLLKGRAPETSVMGGLWRTRRAPGTGPLPSTNPLDHKAGFIWVSPVLPMARIHIERVNTLAERLLNRHGFDYQVTFSMVTARALCAVITISYDKETEGAAALRCHDELLTTLMDAGYIPYRAANCSMPHLNRNSSGFFELLSRLKTALDPDQILAPGRYEPPRR